LHPSWISFRRYGGYVAFVTLAFILLFKVPEQATIGGIMSPFYRDMGFSKTEIATVTKIYGIWIGMLGVFLGGAMVARWGAWLSLGLMVVLCGICNLLYLLLIAFPGNLAVLTLVISGENLTLGMLGPSDGGVPFAAGESLAHGDAVRAVVLAG
jgi:PAT family beta-lactamase induction signal transducer AmpG